jgi:hypothetical protein
LFFIRGFDEEDGREIVPERDDADDVMTNGVMRRSKDFDQHT